MGSKAKKSPRKFDIDEFDDMADFYDDDADIQNLTRKMGNTPWKDFFEADVQMSARRHIERRRDFQKLRSELDEWEQFGDSAGW